MFSDGSAYSTYYVQDINPIRSVMKKKKFARWIIAVIRCINSPSAGTTTSTSNLLKVSPWQKYQYYFLLLQSLALLSAESARGTCRRTSKYRKITHIYRCSTTKHCLHFYFSFAGYRLSIRWSSARLKIKSPRKLGPRRRQHRLFSYSGNPIGDSRPLCGQFPERSTNRA